MYIHVYENSCVQPTYNYIDSYVYRNFSMGKMMGGALIFPTYGKNPGEGGGGGGGGWWGIPGSPLYKTLIYMTCIMY